MTSISTLAQALEQIDRLNTLQKQVGTLQNQVASGQKTDLLSGLGTQLITDERAQAGVSSLTAYSSNNTDAQRRLQMMDSSLQQISQQGQGISNMLSSQNQQGEIDLTTVGQYASNVLAFIKNLVNTQDGNRYLFSGADTTTQPLTDTGTLDTYAQTQINAWVNGTITTDQLIASYHDPAQLTDTTIGYSAQLASGNAKNVYVKADDNANVDVTVLGNDPSIRDIISAATMIQTMCQTLTKVQSSPSDPAGTVTAPGAGQQQQDQNFYQVFNDLVSMLNGAVGGVNQLDAKVGFAQSQINEIQSNQKTQLGVYQNTVSGIESVDMNAAAVQLNVLQNQLQASYQVTAGTQKFSLVNFLPVG